MKLCFTGEIDTGGPTSSLKILQLLKFVGTMLYFGNVYDANFTSQSNFLILFSIESPYKFLEIILSKF